MRVRGLEAAVIGPIRIILFAAAFLVFLAGLQLFVFPLRTADWFAWTIGEPMTAVFLGAAYWSSAILEVAGARSTEWGRARLAVWPVLVFTALTFLVTLGHLDAFHLGPDHPASARLVTWGWLAIYAGVPLALLAAERLQARSRRVGSLPVLSERPRRRLPVGLRVLLAALAVVQIVIGVVLLVPPGTPPDWLWPWPLTALTADAVAAWLIGLGSAAGYAFLIDDVAWVQPLALTGAAFVLLQVIALARHGDALAWSSPSAIVFLLTLAGIGASGVWALALQHLPGGRDHRAAGTPRT